MMLNVTYIQIFKRNWFVKLYSRYEDILLSEKNKIHTNLDILDIIELIF